MPMQQFVVDVLLPLASRNCVPLRDGIVPQNYNQIDCYPTLSSMANR